jgi:hypothetical protein
MTLDNNISSNSLRRERRQFRAKELQSNAYASFRPLATPPKELISWYFRIGRRHPGVHESGQVSAVQLRKNGK